MPLTSRQLWCRRFAILATTVCAMFIPTGRSSCASENSKELAQALIERAGIARGVCAVVGCDGNLAVELAEATKLTLHVRDPRPDAVAALREQADEAGLGIDRLAVEQGRLDRLPYADNMVDVVIATHATPEWLAAVSVDEVLRALRPRGTAILGGKDAAEDPRTLDRWDRWARSGQSRHVKTWSDSFGSWVQFEKPPLEGIDEWSHWEKGPDNNPASTDQVIRAPYMTQFMTAPYYIGMPSITTVAGGRTFLAIGHIAHHRREWDVLGKVIARSGYNGSVLWERKLPEGYLVHRSAFIATDETFYMIDGDRCLLLDAQTGREKGQIQIPGLMGDWKWMAMKGGVLYVLAGKPEPGAETTRGDRTFGGWSWEDLSKGYYGKRIPFGFGDTLAAYHLDQGRLLWKHKEETLIDSRGMALGENKVFLYCPARHLRSLASDSGEILWTSVQSQILELIEEPGRNLISTPGFRTAAITVATPDALIIQGQTRMNVVAVSTKDGYLLWTKKKVTNNPNALYIDGKVILGVGPGGSHVALDPVSGKVEEDLKFLKAACTRLTSSGDSLFCRGEGTLRYDRASKTVSVDGAVRPACNDGALAAGGMLYLGPWQCDCNLSLIGGIAKCSAGDFRFDALATETDRLEKGAGDADRVAPLTVADGDWPTYRGNNHRTGGTKVQVAQAVTRRWQFTPAREHVPTAPVSAGGLVFVAGEDGKVLAIDAEKGTLRWQFATSSPIKHPPTIWDGRAYFGSGDGYVYAVEATTGRLLWRFRAAPVQRNIMVYGTINSTWPVASGVLVEDGVAYFAAGIIDHDGTYVYALDAKSGKIRWQNNSSGHLNPELRKGVSVQGNLAIMENRLLLAGGNQFSPASYDLKTGQCLAEALDDGRPKANHGRFVGVFLNGSVIAGGRVLYSAAENVPSKGTFDVKIGQRTFHLNYGGIPPAWDENIVALAHLTHGKLTCCESDQVATRLDKARDEPPARPAWLVDLASRLKVDDAIRWKATLGETNQFEGLSLAVCPGAVVAVVQSKPLYRAHPEWHAVAYDAKDGKIIWQEALDSEPLPGGLLIDRQGNVVVTMLNGNVVCLGSK